MTAEIVIDSNTNFYIGDQNAPDDVPQTAIKIGLVKDPHSNDDMHIPIRDGKNDSDRLKLAISTIKKTWWDARHGKFGQKRDVLVHCAAGMSRSPMAAKCIAYTNMRSWDMADTALKEKMLHDADIHPALEEQMKQATEELIHD